MNNSNVRMLIFDLGSASRNELVRQLEDHLHIKMVGQTAHRGQAIRLLQQLMPGPLTLTLDISNADNIKIVEAIMAISTIPILVMRFCPGNQQDDSYISRDTLAVLHHGNDSSPSTDALHHKIELLIDVKVIRHIKGLRYLSEPVIPTVWPVMDVIKTPQSWPFVLTIACSTDGPQALSKLLQDLPGTSPCPVLITQHTADDSAKNVIHWLDSVTDLKARLAQEDDRVEAGYVHILLSKQHPIVKSNQHLAAISRREGDAYHPNCNLSLEPMVEVFREKAIGLIMTGMGSDDCHGIELIVRRGRTTLTQDEESSVVFGMNKNAIDKRLIHRMIPLDGPTAVLLSMACHGRIESKSP